MISQRFVFAFVLSMTVLGHAQTSTAQFSTIANGVSPNQSSGSFRSSMISTNPWETQFPENGPILGGEFDDEEDDPNPVSFDRIDVNLVFDQGPNSLGKLKIHGSNDDDEILIYLADGGQSTVVEFSQKSDGQVIDEGTETFSSDQVGFITVDLWRGDDELEAWYVGNNMKASGGPGNDILIGTNGGNTLRGGEGDDILDGSACLRVTAKGGPGNDVIYGSPGDDVLLGSIKADRVQYGDDDDDEIYGYGGDDELEGGMGSDTLVAGSGDDTLDGGNGDDYLSGGSGHDDLRGGYGLDSLDGGAGNDYLNGSNDGRDDFLMGGSGADIFIMHKHWDYWPPFVQSVEYENTLDYRSDEGDCRETDWHAPVQGQLG